MIFTLIGLAITWIGIGYIDEYNGARTGIGSRPSVVVPVARIQGQQRKNYNLSEWEFRDRGEGASRLSVPLSSTTCWAISIGMSAADFTRCSRPAVPVALRSRLASTRGMPPEAYFFAGCPHWAVAARGGRHIYLAWPHHDSHVSSWTANGAGNQTCGAPGVSSLNRSTLDDQTRVWLVPVAILRAAGG